jgi:uridine kinase
MRAYVVGIAGGTASGKTTIAEAFAQQENAALVGHDRYYKDIPDPRTFNYDHPDALDTALLCRQVIDLQQGKGVDLPVYHFNSHRRSDEVEHLAARELVVVEGILVLQDPALRAAFDLCIWVEAPADIRLIRRLRRDTVKRGRTMENVLDQYEATVRPMHELFVQPSSVYASVQLDGLAPLSESLEKLAAAVRAGRAARRV